jgi:hypothetical protein
MANAVAAYYVSSPSANHPTIPKLIEFCQKQLQLKNNSLRMRKQNIEKK